MSTKISNKRSSNINNNFNFIGPTQRVNVDVLKHRLYLERKKERFKKTILVSSVVASFGVLSLIVY